MPLFKDVPAKNLRKLLKDGERRIIQKKQVPLEIFEKERHNQPRARNLVNGATAS